MTTTEPTQAEMCYLIARKLMGLHPYKNGMPTPDVVDWQWDRLPDYFTDPAAMVALLEKVGIWPQCVGSGWVSIGTHPTNICESPMHAVALAAYQLALTR